MPASRTNCDASEAFSISVGYGWRRFLKNQSRRIGTESDSDLEDLSCSPEKVAMLLSGSMSSPSAPIMRPSTNENTFRDLCPSTKGVPKRS